ncbi:MAG: thioredoxin [Candidatus Omnitrophica bacterium]|nr:thioredoxin [Candidatus Omnitrophota bacterium]
MASENLSVNDSNFEEEVVKSDKPVLVDFWAEWCGPCKIMSPIVEELSASYAGKIKIKKLDVDSNANTPSRYNVLNIPTLIFFKGGEEIERMVGVVSKKDLIKKIEGLISA